ncbi:MAG TPA: HAMP domain-containing sensor histidine kinase [Kofleriaceae bacterium]|jgi:signal transduction histidine kinase|nr:HAMP domain-containing sensor histidine kinase [Kofleriaceae bacterium]
MSLRRSFLVFAAVLAVIGTGVAIALIILTTNLRREAEEVGTEVENLRTSEELELELISLREEADPLGRAAIEGVIRHELAEAARYITIRQEEEILAELTRRVDQYIAALDRAATAEVVPERVRSNTRAAFQPVLALARQWIQLNVEQGNAAERAAALWAQVAVIIGVAAILLLVTGLGGVAWWLQRRTFRPALELAGAIDRYTRGDRSARASEQEPEEFRTIARGFNDMARALDRQRADQLAFLGGVAHEIRSPLGVLKMATEMILPDQPLPPEPAVRQLVARIDRQIGRLERMAHDFLDASRIESGHLELKFEDCDVRELVRVTLDLFEPAAGTHPLAVSAPDEPVCVRCDPIRIEQVLSNLVSNAIKYSPPGGSVRVTVAQRPEAIVISVADEGVGMSADDVEHVFDPFRRGAGVMRAIPGAGLGLFVARRIVEAHGGKIAVESVQGAGTTFTVHLPVGAFPEHAARGATGPGGAAEQA